MHHLDPFLPQSSKTQTQTQIPSQIPTKSPLPPLHQTNTTLVKQAHRLISRSNLQLIKHSLHALTPLLPTQRLRLLRISPRLRPTNDILNLLARVVLRRLEEAVAARDGADVGACWAFEAVL